MQEKTIIVAAASTAVSLNIHKRKSKILRYNTPCTNPITIDGEDLGDVKTFTYLGSIIDEHAGPYQQQSTMEQTRSQRRKKSGRSAGSG
ncbi:unnamed protein product [Schistosoma margrebowiei]|uniref:Uncharacterized protein n=1 Tax=Schistosoma margrebowiei TaxID=48269 RepID=A0A183LR62_9TREM|nr:unnamed protein product [Schistosoma margrebowiei]